MLAVGVRQLSKWQERGRVVQGRSEHREVRVMWGKLFFEKSSDIWGRCHGVPRAA